MYFEYCLYAALVVLGAGVVAWLWLKLTGRNDRTNICILAAGTLSALAASLIIPSIARLLHERASLSPAVSVVFAFVLCSAAIGLGFLIYKAVTALFGAKARVSPADADPSGRMADIYSQQAPEPASKPAFTPRPEPMAKPASPYEPGPIQEPAPTFEPEPVPTPTFAPEPEVTPTPVSAPAPEPMPAPLPAKTGADIGIITEKYVDTGRITDRIGVEEDRTNEKNIRILLENAIDMKTAGRLAEAADNYRQLMYLTSDKGFAVQIIIELCSILKKLNNAQLIHKILESERGDLLTDDMKADIINNI